MGMSRKAFAAVIVLLLAGLSPAAAIIGFCSRMPCCSHASADTHFTTERTDCCTTVACFDAPSAKMNPRAADNVTTAPPVTLPYAAITRRVAAPAAIHLPDPWPPPGVTARLAVLSILII